MSRCALCGRPRPYKDIDLCESCRAEAEQATR